MFAYQVFVNYLILYVLCSDSYYDYETTMPQFKNNIKDIISDINMYRVVTKWINLQPLACGQWLVKSAW